MSFYHKDSIKRQLYKHCLETILWGFLVFIEKAIFFWGWCEPLLSSVAVAPFFVFTFSLLSHQSQKILIDLSCWFRKQLWCSFFLVTFLGIHWYCFLSKWWAKYWLLLLVRSHYSSALSHESQNSFFVIKISLSSVLLTELWNCLKFEGFRVRMTSLGASHTGRSRTCGSERVWRKRVALWLSCREARLWCK